MFEASEFTNMVGQVISPGDPVVCVTKSTGNVGVYKGVFAGLNKNERGQTTSYCVHYFPGKRYVLTGKLITHTYTDYRGNERSYTTKEGIFVEDDKYFTRRTLYDGRIFKLV